MFIRRFHRPGDSSSVATPLPKGEEFKQRLQELQRRHGIQQGESPPQTWKRLGWRPPGSSHACGRSSLAGCDRLSYGSGSTLAFLDADFGSPMEPSILINGSFLRRRSTGGGTDRLCLSLGDDIDTVTIVRLAVKYQHTENVKEILVQPTV